MPETDISLWELNRHFSAWTSVNGLPHVILTDSNALQFIWAIITFGALFAGIYQTGSLIFDYFSYAVRLETRTQTGTLAFPTVTICSVNAWKLGMVAGTLLQPLITAYNSPGPSARFGLGWPPSEQRRLRAQQWQWQMGERLGQLAQGNSSRIAYSFEELIHSCRFDGRPCNRSDFDDYFDPYYGHCFTFNMQGLLNSTRAGPRNGLQLELRVDSQELLPWVQTQGALVAVDIARATPYIDAYGYLVRPGFDTKLGIQYNLRQKLPAPFNNCTDSPESVSSQKIYYQNVYEVDACIRSCLQDRIISVNFLCGCYSPMFNRPANSSHPPARLSCLDAPNPNWALDCVNDVLKVKEGNQWRISHCDCPFGCESVPTAFSTNLTFFLMLFSESYYQVSTSEARWPARNYIPPECANQSLVARRWNGSVERCQRWMGQNSLLVQVFHQRISTISVLEQQAYEIIDFIADAGGALGLWLGMSAISIIECFILLAMAMAYCCARPARKARLRPGYDYFATFTKPKSTELYEKEKEVPIPPRVREAAEFR